jgi:hypothetical protein
VRQRRHAPSEARAGAPKKPKPQPEVEASDWGRKCFRCRSANLG